MNRRRDLVNDERGAILVVGVFAAAFLFGAVYFVLGVGDAVQHRETMQDAADTGAYATAVLHARAMNLIALLNMVKLSLAAIVAALLAVMIAATKTIAFIQASPARLAALGAAIPLLVAVHARALADHTSIRGDVDAVLNAADRAQETLRDRLPEIAAGQATQAAIAYGPPVEQGTVVTSALPVRRGEPLALCERALPLARPLALDAFDPVAPVPARTHARGEAELALMPSCLGLGVAAMELEPGTALGGERLQLRFFSVGATPSSRGQSGVEVATWARNGAQVEGGSVGFAQAEYYFDGEGAEAQEQADALFSMRWRARFRRFRTPNLAGDINAACGRAGAASCADPAGSLEAERIAH
ncbi:MAG TPA: hypothetical protein VNO33_15555 [Kofleriaceae bacterium]|nr:hypothetical protein [Kofleriaceae bacterium]